MSEVLLQISAGTGPDECAMAVALLAETLLGQAGGLKVQEVDRQESVTKGCLRSLLLWLEGETASAFAKSWEGSILWRCKSPLRPNHQRKNWYVDVSCFPVPNAEDPTLGAVRETCCRASGPGGQHVNKTNSAVRLVHMATGITVTASEERSQGRNRKLAYARLWARLRQQQQHQADAAKIAMHQAHHHLERGNPVKTFVGLDFKPA